MLIKIIVCIIAGMGAGIGTGLAGLSAAAVIAPMLITFLGVPAYDAIGIGLASDVLASASSAYTYGKNKNLDIRNGLVMLCTVQIFTLLSSYLASLISNSTMGNFSVFITFILGVKFIVRPVMTTKEQMADKSRKEMTIKSILGGIVIGSICGFFGAGGGMMMLLVLTSILGFELKTAVGTSVFIMSFTAFTGSVSHFVIGGIPDITCLIICVISTLVFARLASVYANKSKPIILNRVTGVILAVLGLFMMLVQALT